MHMKFRGVNDAFRGLVGLFDEASRDKEDQSASEVEVIKTQSRNGSVLQILEPMIITYERPSERILFNKARDANPFIHLYESLWMLAGRNDIAPLCYYASQFVNYSDDGVTQPGAYGYRWRHAPCEYTREREVAGVLTEIDEGPFSVHCKTDQLKVIINHLKAKPESRRAVLHMSNVEDDLLKMDTTKDQCCNLCCCFLLRDERTDLQYTQAAFVPEDLRGKRIGSVYLDMTVFNRSNDLVWGMLGANVVHFSFLLEYMAAQLGVEVGVYNQVPNNLHIYTENNSGFRPQEWLAEYKTPEYNETYPKTVPLVKDPASFDRELLLIVSRNANGDDVTSQDCYVEPFLNDVAQPMFNAFHMHKQRNYGNALYWIDEVRADDWKIAGRNWILKRKQNWEAKQHGIPSCSDKV